MMMIPVHVIVFFIALAVLPADVRQFTVNLNGKTVQWTQRGESWHAVQLPGDDWGDYTRSNAVVSVSDKGRVTSVNVEDFIQAAGVTNGATVTAFAVAREGYGSPIQVKREPNRITLWQDKPGLLRLPSTITW